MQERCEVSERQEDKKTRRVIQVRSKERTRREEENKRIGGTREK